MCCNRFPLSMSKKVVPPLHATICPRYDQKMDHRMSDRTAGMGLRHTAGQILVLAGQTCLQSKHGSQMLCGEGADEL